MRCGRFLVAALVLLLAAGCGDGSGTQAATGQAPTAQLTEGPVAPDTDAEAADEDVDPKESDRAGDLSSELPAVDEDDDKAPQEVSTQVQPALMSLDGRVCEQLPLPAIRELIGPEATFNDVTPDTCTYTAVVGSEATVVSLTRTEFMGDAALFDSLVATVAESLDADMTAEPIAGIGEQSFLLEGGLGTYVHARTGSLYLVVFVDGADDDVMVADAITRLALGG